MAKAPAKKPAAAKKTAAPNNQPKSKGSTLAAAQPEHAAPVEHVDNTVKASGVRDGSM